MEPEENKLESKPLISVIILAYSRQTFLEDAVNSVFGQTLSSELYEIILVKNFNNKFTNSLVAEGKIKPVNSNEKGMGAFIRSGIEQSRGDIIVFLEDDDKWDPARLERVLTHFTKYSTLSYYHNSILEIDEKGNKLPEPSEFESGKWIGEENCILIEDNEKRSVVNKIGKYFPDFNLSSIAISKSVAETVNDFLMDIDTAVDTFIFFASLGMSGQIILDPAKLTLYRHHSMNQSGSKLGGSDAYLGSLYSFSSRAIPAYEWAIQFLQTSYPQRGYLIKLAKRRVIFSKLLNSMQNPNINRVKTLKLALSLLPYVLVFNSELNIKSLLLGFLYSIWPSYARIVLASKS